MWLLLGVTVHVHCNYQGLIACLRQHLSVFCVYDFLWPVSKVQGRFVNLSMKVNLVNDNVHSAFLPTLLSLSFALHF